MACCSLDYTSIPTITTAQVPHTSSVTPYIVYVPCRVVPCRVAVLVYSRNEAVVCMYSLVCRNAIFSKHGRRPVFTFPTKSRVDAFKDLLAVDSPLLLLLLLLLLAPCPFSDLANTTCWCYCMVFCVAAGDDAARKEGGVGGTPHTSPLVVHSTAVGGDARRWAEKTAVYIRCVYVTTDLFHERQ